MNEHRKKILEMLAAGKITTDEAERLLTALQPDTAVPSGEYTGVVAGAPVTVKTRAKFLRVLVEADESMTGMWADHGQRARAHAIAARRRASRQPIPAQADDQLDQARAATAFH